MTTVAEIMRKQPILTVNRDDTIKNAAEKMSLNRVGSLLVLRHDRTLIGIISERDIVRAVGEGADPGTTLVEQYMSPNPITVRPEDSIVSAAQKMITHGIRHLPVVDAARRVVGVVSIRDVLRHIISEHEFP